MTPDLNLYDRSWPIFTYQEQLPPAKFVFNSDDRRGMAVDSLVSGGCIISGAQIQDSLLFSQSQGELLFQPQPGGRAAPVRDRPPCPADQGGG